MNSFQTAFWKLLTLGGVISAGCFVVMQVQEGLGDLATSADAAPMTVVPAAFANDPEAEQFALGASVPADRPDAVDTRDSFADDFGNEPFFANVADEAPVEASSNTAQPANMLLAQATPASNPFDFGSSAPLKKEPTLAPKRLPEVAPGPRTLPTDDTAKPIGRAAVDTLQPTPHANPFAAETHNNLPAVRPAGGLQPIPTQGGMPVIQPAAGKDTDLNLEPIPDPFELNIAPIDSAAPAPAPVPAAAAPPADSNPFSLDLTPLPANEPIRSASAVNEPSPAPALEPMPVLENVEPIEPVPSAAPMTPLPSANPLTPLPDASPAPFDAMPTRSAAAAAPPRARAGLEVGAPISPSPIDFLGDATIDRDVPRGAVQPHLQMTKSAPGRASLGKPMVYEIKVANVGNATAYNVEVEDRIPKGSRLEGTNPQAEMPDGSKKLVWRFDAVGPGETKSLKVRIVPVEPGKIGSIATVKFSAETAAETHIAAPQLQFRLVGDPEAAVRDKVMYRFEIANTGDEDAQDVVIRCLVPDGLQSPNQVRDLEYPVGLLAAGSTKNVDLPLTAIGEGHYTTKATLEASDVSPIDSTSDIHIIKSRLALDRTGPGKRYVGSKVQFTNRITNNSSKTLTGIRIAETLPDNAKFVTASDSGSQVDAKTVAWTIPSLGPGQTKDVSITLVPEDAGKKVSMVNAVAADGSQVAIKASMTVVGFAALDLVTSHVNRPYAIDEEVTLQMTIKNGGTAVANAVETSVRVPPELRFLSASGPVQYSQIGDTVTFSPIPQVSHGSEAKFELKFKTLKQGDGTLNMQLRSNDLERGLIEQVAIKVYGP